MQRVCDGGRRRVDGTFRHDRLGDRSCVPLRSGSTERAPSAFLGVFRFHKAEIAIDTVGPNALTKAT
jgi:hypothetical protein